MASKLKPSSLGSGMAQRVASGLKARKSKMDEAIEGSSRGKALKKIDKSTKTRGRY